MNGIRVRESLRLGLQVGAWAGCRQWVQIDEKGFYSSADNQNAKDPAKA